MIFSVLRLHCYSEIAELYTCLVTGIDSPSHTEACFWFEVGLMEGAHTHNGSSLYLRFKPKFSRLQATELSHNPHHIQADIKPIPVYRKVVMGWITSLRSTVNRTHD